MRPIPGTITDRGLDHLIPKGNREEVEEIWEASESSVDFSLGTYQELAVSTAIYPEKFAVIYPILGVANEGGEVAGKLKKLMRDEGFDGTNLTSEQRDALVDELGDVMWYVANSANDLGVSLYEVADRNLQKLFSRKERGVLGGSGDNR